MTNKKDLYQYRIFKTYSMLVRFDGEPHRENVPAPLVGRETFEKWKGRVLGHQVSNVKVFVEYEPTPRTQVSTIQGWSDMTILRKVFNALAVEKKNRVRKEVTETANAIKETYMRFSQDTLLDLLDEVDDLQPAVRDFFQRFIDSTDDDIDTTDMLRLLIDQFNSNANQLRNADAKIKRMENELALASTRSSQ